MATKYSEELLYASQKAEKSSLALPIDHLTLCIISKTVLIFKLTITLLPYHIKRPITVTRKFSSDFGFDILRKILALLSLPKKCAAFYPKLCILNFPTLGHCSVVRVS